MKKEKINVFWFRRDLRLKDNRALWEALKSQYPILPLFIFDTQIIQDLEHNDPRLLFIYDQLQKLQKQFSKFSSSLYCLRGRPVIIWKKILNDFNVQEVYANEDYEPYARKRDDEIGKLLGKADIKFKLYKDQVIFAKSEIVKKDNTPYTIFTPYKNRWLEHFKQESLKNYNSEASRNFMKADFSFPTLSQLGLHRSQISVKDYNLSQLKDYEKYRNFPAPDKTSHLSPHLRFGTISIRQVVNKTRDNSTFLAELIWREFFMQILYNFPRVVNSNFRSKYDQIKWRDQPSEFEKWKNGKTGYPLVDAGMRELKATGYMHNRVRMVAAGFLCKHLLIDWRWGEAYFAEKLLDYELSSNNGNWQWAAGTGSDAAPYFRVFNPTSQLKKYDPEQIYIKKWIPELNTANYPEPMVEHKTARKRAIEVYKSV